MRAFSLLAAAEWGRFAWVAIGTREPADAWTTTADAFAAMENPYGIAYSRFREAESRLRSRSDRPAAIASLVDAHRIATRLGARPLLREISEVATRARITLDGRAALDATPAKAAPPAGLTERELEVIRLVAAGRTNRQIATALFITEKTAGLHVSNILAKLTVSNRVEAAAAARRLGIEPAAPAD